MTMTMATTMRRTVRSCAYTSARCTTLQRSLPTLRTCSRSFSRGYRRSGSGSIAFVRYEYVHCLACTKCRYQYQCFSCVPLLRQQELVLFVQVQSLPRAACVEVHAQAVVHARRECSGTQWMGFFACRSPTAAHYGHHHAVMRSLRKERLQCSTATSTAAARVLAIATAAGSEAITAVSSVLQRFQERPRCQLLSARVYLPEGGDSSIANEVDEWRARNLDHHASRAPAVVCIPVYRVAQLALHAEQPTPCALVVVAELFATTT